MNKLLNTLRFFRLLSQAFYQLAVLENRMDTFGAYTFAHSKLQLGCPTKSYKKNKRPNKIS